MDNDFKKQLQERVELKDEEAIREFAESGDIEDLYQNIDTSERPIPSSSKNHASYMQEYAKSLIN